MNSLYKIFLFGILVILFSDVYARENMGFPKHTNSGNANNGSGKTTVADCKAATGNTELNVNNVRCWLLTGGDLWWDTNSNPHYEVPKVPSGERARHSIFAGALWIGGIDPLNQLKVAAQTYRQTGNDFFPGPLDQNGQVSAETCHNFDRFWEVLGQDITLHRAKIKENGGTISVADIKESILGWPARNNQHFSEFNSFDLIPDKDYAPYWDANNNEQYDPENGDYPVINARVEGIYADQMIWWVFNDLGNTHTETGAEAIGLEVGALAFAFANSNEINSMTFYRYQIDNKSTLPLDSVYFGQWVDPDLGDANDDFVGCVPEEGLGIVYNGTQVDNVYNEIGLTPMAGVDFFKGPRKIKDTDGDGKLDTTILGMNSFVYYNNDFEDTGNPENASDFYGYMAGYWKDNTPFTFGGNGYNPSGDPYPYMFPSDPSLKPYPTYWSECSVGNTAADRRFLQSAGPFSLDPGAVNEIIVGVVWVPNGGGCPDANFSAILRADKKAQSLFNNNFKLVDGPDAPNIAIRELDRQVILNLWNDVSSNNYLEQYKEADPVLRELNDPDSLYLFEGYKIYQLPSPEISNADFETKGRIVAQVDIKNGVKKIINYAFDENVAGNIPVPRVAVDGADQGVFHTFNITEDLFAQGADKKLVNNKKYYFAAVAYAFNANEQYNPDSSNANSAQFEPYLEGRLNIKKYTAIPHKLASQQNGIITNASYSDGPDITQIEGIGNMGIGMELTEESVNTILSSPDHYIENPVYVGGKAPIQVKVTDPLNVKQAKFRTTIVNKDTLLFVDKGNNVIDTIGSLLSPISPYASWITEQLNNDGSTIATYNGESFIKNSYEQAIGGWQNNSLGFTLNVVQTQNPSSTFNANISSKLKNKEPQNNWLGFIEDDDGRSYYNWIRSGTYDDSGTETTHDYLNDFKYDTLSYYEDVLNGAFAPYCLANADYKAVNSNTYQTVTPGCDCNTSAIPTNTLSSIASVDIVFTSDKSKWTKVNVIEMSKDDLNSQGKAEKNGIRRLNSMDKDGNYAKPLQNDILEPDNIYYVMGSSAASISYNSSTGTNVVQTSSKFFKANNIIEATAFTALNGAMVFNASDIGQSWFPGYAINIETGQRLNMLFSENSFMPSENGKDMIWNPTSRRFSSGGFVGDNNLRFGGEHYIYVMSTLYDEGAAHHSKFIDATLLTGNQQKNKKREVYNEAMWVGTSLLNPGYTLKPLSEGLIPSEITISIREHKAYELSKEMGTWAVLDTIDKTMPVDSVRHTLTKKLVYEYDFGKLATQTNQIEVAQTAMDLIKVVPNPYYGFSPDGYETNSLDTKVKITNLPPLCNISIFMVDGTLIRTIKVDNRNLDTATGKEVGLETPNYVEWDLKNFKNVPIASGLYLIHIEAPELGEERTLKWFGILRPFDLDIY